MNTVPYVIEQSNRGERSYDIFSRLLEDRIIILAEEVSNASAALVTAQLLYLEGRDPEKDICLYINSPGGSTTAGFSILDTMNYIKCDVSTICIGMAASFGALLLTAGAKGKRFALPDSEIMIHQPSIMGDGMKGRASDIKIWSDYMQKNKQRINRILVQNTGRPIEEIERDTDRDHFMSAQEAKEYGLIDDVITSRDLPVKL
ncbi:MAG TPA: ATP-dependent Clp protease proteolytic subunit [Caproicibacter sp.]|nr:ATP-dependent Clp protease proteolytic subunit [Caproicibacter sp.]